MVMIREARADDSRGLASLRATWAAEQDPTTPDDPHFEDAYLNWMEANPRKFFVAEQDNQLIGMLNLLVFQRMPKPGKQASCWVYLGNVYVVPAFRNGGVGGRLVDASIEFSERIRAARMVLSPSSESQSFYRRLGFGPAEELRVRAIQAVRP
ncbi:GNAT family N-acetyltransferase [Pseudarthrobacter sp. CCNWLW207]|uniref:GNAT family N-acetyltransferase n=1 Tax=Pseudarthrobacter sp. CCNWLW207 TaxID=3127468 RepID=UPI003076E12D